MRINLNCPYSEKDEAKALGAKWDSEKKVWYVVDVKDLTPFAKWLTLIGGKREIPKKRDVEPRTTGKYQPICSCQIPPWEDCEHSEAATLQAMREMIDLPF